MATAAMARRENPQVLVGLVLVDGWPIAHHVFEGVQHLNAVAQRIDARKFNRSRSAVSLQ
jgi:hypothetical protein